MSQLIDSLAKTNSLPSPPGVALEIMRINEQEEVSISELAEIISRDPAIAAKLLKTANSSAMGRPGQVGDIQDAVMLLGIRSVNLLALSFSLASTSSDEIQGSFDTARFWTAGAATTSASRMLAEKYCRAHRDEAFLAGLLCDFSQLILAMSANEIYEPVVREVAKSQRSPQSVERELLSTDHALVGEEIFRRWGLPSVICEAVGAHHDPSRLSEDSPARDLARVLHLGSLCGSLYVFGDLEEADELVAFGQSYFDMSAEECQELLDSLREAVPELLEILDLKSIDTAEVSRIRGAANELLVRESLELEHRVQTISTTLQRLEHQNSQLEKQISMDPLTGLPNRVFFEGLLESEVERVAAGSGSTGVLMIDVDSFKQINDTHGHLAGDTVLKGVAALIESHLGSNQYAVRCGGDEFLVVCQDLSVEGLLERAQLLRKGVEGATFSHEGAAISTSVSIGGCVFSGSATRVEVLTAADSELYRAKARGRNRAFVSAFAKRVE